MPVRFLGVWGDAEASSARRAVPPLELEDNCFRSCAHWLSYRIGLDLGTARQYVRVARALCDLPRISEAFSQGVISFSKVRAITRIASPETEETLLLWAKQGSASHVEKLVRTYRRGSRLLENEQAQRQREERELSYHHDESGMLILKARLPPEEGALFLKALEAIRDELRKDESSPPQKDVSDAPEAEPKDSDAAHVEPKDSDTSHPTPDDSAESPWKSERAQGLSAQAHPTACAELPKTTDRQRMADALVELSSRALSAKAGNGDGDERYLVTIHIDAEVLCNPDADGRSELEDGPSIAPDTVRRLLCNAAIRPMVHGKEGEITPLRRTRLVKGPLRRALLARDGTRCIVPGCPCRGRDAHHVVSWVDGGPTSLENTASTCRYHHSLIHQGVLRMEAADKGSWRFFDRHGRELVEAPPLPAVTGDAGAILAERWIDQEVEITPYTGESTWDGEPIDYGWAVDDLLARAGLL